MKVVRYPDSKTLETILRRPATDTTGVEATVRSILDTVRSDGDDALRTFTKQFDGAEISDLQVSEEEFEQAAHNVSDKLKSAIEIAKENLTKFHISQREKIKKVETTYGVFCWRKSVPIEKVGLYIPAGTAPLFSTVLMLGIPAKLAGCDEIVLCSPPDSDGRINDAVLYSARVCGITKVFKIGGAQAIGAMAFGTESVPQVYKIFGPGNNYVTCAKQMVSSTIAIDMPAGPSELAVVADDSACPSFVAADLLSQAEHGTDSQVILVSNSESLIAETIGEIDKQILSLPRREIARSSLANSKAILVKDIDEALTISNKYAPEHLILATRNAEELAENVKNAGSVFLGNYSCEAAGDYASGTNHTLPTNGFARSFSGVSLDSFFKKITFQQLSPKGLLELGPAIEQLAAAEGLEAHKRAVSIRLEALNAI